MTAFYTGSLETSGGSIPARLVYAANWVRKYSKSISGIF